MKLNPFGFLKKNIQQIIPLTGGKLFHSLWGYGSSNYNTRSIKEFVNKGFGKNPFVYMSVKKIADTISRLNIVDERGNTAVLFNDNSSFKELIEQMVTQLLVTGNCFIYGITPVGFNSIKSLEIIPAQLIKPITNNKNELLYWEWQRGNQTIRLEVDEVYNIHFANPVEPYSHFGLSPLESAFDTVIASNNIFTAEAHIFKNRGISGLLTNDSARPMLPDHKDEVQKQMNSDFGGADKANKVLVSTEKLRFVQVGMSPQDLEIIKNNLQKMRVITAIYGLDSALFNDPDNKTYSNRKEAEKSLYTNVCIPLCNYILS
jgi:HK97 family phage portal protein